MSSDEEFDTTPELSFRHSQVQPYMHEPLARTVSNDDHNNKSSSNDFSENTDSDKDIESRPNEDRIPNQSLDVLRHTTGDQHGAQGLQMASQPDERIVEWCTCGSCVKMPSAKKDVCCQQYKKIKELLNDQISITDLPSFVDNCLNRNVLEASRWEYMEQDGPSGNEITLNESFRFLAYRRFCYIVFHRLGRRNRKVLPSCVVARIRNCFPDQDGSYTGFKVA